MTKRNNYFGFCHLDLTNMTFFVCSNCGYGSASWMGKCPDCGKWNTLVEKPEFAKTSSSKATKKIKITKLKTVASSYKIRFKTGIFEIDRVIGGGFIPGEVVLLTGEPGVGKSTLILQSLQNIPSLYISGEESAEQVKVRADRLKINLDNFYFSNDTQVEGIIAGLEDLSEEVKIVVIDSIQTIFSKDIEGPIAGISQLKEVANKLISFAKKNKITVILIGHITKVGEIAGPKTLEHLVDCVLNFEGEKISQYRLLRASKNRFGSTDEIGIFEMSGGGLKEVTNPLVFLEQKNQYEPGKAIVGVTEGKRPLFFEIQTLVSSTVFAVPRRVVKGLDYNKTLLLIAVVKKYLYLPLDSYDIYVNVIGGVSIKSTSSDLGFIASLLSSFKNIPLPKSSLFIGEVGLLGEVRASYFEDKIVSEGKRLGFKKIFSSLNVKNIKDLKILLR
ncbi:DNA repair protein RadA [Candidatus Roizmanbacteria bacterium CG22_combo_CG10-13_8_21_14_all_35_9]|uniref:DNA repair protein RadA n=3 Tax=Candidatus Roizmaniibacteriota TaxID=1752723 RepID=A0A2H0BXS5_9BACT|nr:MAG: DNA repair protein RadA [Candidatus Roizmanbacteria bacterium CG23_combo_of_CG06-09_8_20_14_all_35_49]PIP62339.1 MAG: DNA repair protein RadA [Candidatus Roizmanbacteria bacterium CG22_combo_CG10-13_8_21_14_all_35_9]PIY71249.1 MAG: DNA repair protein RadA [Candidatus Roizmanbacteria bacterium CG_4_10_14_0_8_um_filter_35_28]PJC84143.1 MAG: DNA repair protein RadA [Candidatus Roizmanbacteria bacterium CG_4_8_14_3_um_filter_35_14]